MKKLFIYYSLTGNGDNVAKLFESKGYEVRKVIEDRKLPKAFFFKMMVGGFLAATNKVGKLIDYNNDVSEYDEIVIGSPIWNKRFPPATNAILKETNFENRKLTFVIYSGSGEGPKALKKVNELYKEANVIFLQEPKKHEDELKKLDPLF